ncbi:hypothetical protein FCIRC_12174 [Fusarium circinatum]|uniref:Uncharacterized protein n=1 Tax=Fusarium circinatum TaxID=48490 RepID=A0A8H5SWH8_FUSCI|nr:hypothetical protein FCIRC_12174 [Fusarium circinatum]
MLDQASYLPTSEAVCNGIWKEILRRHFPHPKFIIAPEQRQTTGKRPDLTIFHVDDSCDWEPIFTFEGKAPYYIDKDSIINDGINQAAGYLKSLAWSEDKWVNEKKKMTYGMLACGKSFMILQYDVENKQISRIDPSTQTERGDFATSSLDNEAHAFDDFCHDFAASIL